jgi:hypothetical protein
MSETWSNLLSGAIGAIFGAIVGGTFSLLGTMLVNKQQMATNARMRLYDELLPKVLDRVNGMLDSDLDPASAYVAEEQIPDLLGAVQRASAIAGRVERKAAHNLWVLWVKHVDAPTPAMRTDLPKSHSADPPDPPGHKRPPSAAELRLGKIQEELQAFSDALGAKLGPTARR